MAQKTDDFLEHYGVKGMRWGVRKRSSESGGSGGGAARPNRKELRKMNKEARARIRKEKADATAKNDSEILAARAARKETNQAIKAARKQYKGDKKMIGRVAAREIYNKNLEKPLSTLDKANQLTSKEEANLLLLDIGVAVLKTAARA